MREKLNLWRLYNSASAYGKSPHEFFPALETDLAKWALDEITLITGRAFENALQEGKDPFKGSEALSSKQYASAPRRKIRKVKSLKEIGIQNGNSPR
ncbi:MAG: hypothetical protein DYG85_06450 [Chloroflexi bacterium CFX1]|nr:hypothetical protein [Chloroflexi bacterium CFX1]